MSEKKRILIISDSLALPRNKPEKTIYEDTYPYLLSKDFEVFQISFGGGTIKEIVHQANYYVSYNPDFVVLQSGIVDCAYRSFPLIIDKGALYCKAFDVSRRIIARLISPKKLRRFFRIRYTKPKDFEKSLRDLKAEFPTASIIAIGIVPASNEYIKLVPGIDRSIEQYNSIIKRTMGSGVVDLDKMPKECIMSDYHHINKMGHRYIYNSLIELINQGE